MRGQTVNSERVIWESTADWRHIHLLPRSQGDFYLTLTNLPFVRPFSLASSMQHLMFSLDSIRACSPAIDPSPHPLCSFLPRKRRQAPSVSGIPAPTYKVIVSDVVVELFKSAIAILFRIFNLATEIGSGTSDKNHLVFGSGERPFGISGRHVFAGEICGLVASVATHGAGAVAVFAAVDILHVDVTVIALERSVACGMAVLTSRRSENFVDL
jgi:hypothetical protein